MRFLIVAILAGVWGSGCTATMVNEWADDLETVGSQRGGTFSYLDQGADFVIEQRREDGINQAKQFCGSRPLFFLGEQQVTSTSIGSVPIIQTAYHQGTLGSGLSSANYKGTSTFTTHSPTTYTWNRNKVSFICCDADVSEISYEIRFGRDGGGVCVNLPDGFTPGEKRLNKIAAAATTEDCSLKEGWMRYLAGDENIKVHIFIGKKGKSLCQKIEREMVDQQVSSAAANLWLRKRLVCGRSILTH